MGFSNNSVGARDVELGGVNSSTNTNRSSLKLSKIASCFKDTCLDPGNQIGLCCLLWGLSLGAILIYAASHDLGCPIGHSNYHDHCIKDSNITSS